MTIEKEQGEGFITLKEASERFGYAPDYIGQLIRKGKLDGKQVYANVAWVTTNKAMEEYMLREKGKKDAAAARPWKKIADAIIARLFSGRMGLLYVFSLRMLLAALILFAIFSFYLLSVAIDHYLVERAKQDLLLRKSEMVQRASDNDKVMISKISYGAR